MKFILNNRNRTYRITRANANTVVILDEKGSTICTIPADENTGIEVHGSIEDLIKQYNPSALETIKGWGKVNESDN